MSVFDVVLVTFGLNFIAAAGWIAGACGGLAIGIRILAKSVRKLID